jgi:hypothetical protein
MNSEKPGVDRRGFLKRAGLLSAAAEALLHAAGVLRAGMALSRS